MKNVALLAVFTFTVLAVALVPQATARQQARRVAQAPKVAHSLKVMNPEVGNALRRGIAAHRAETWRWQKVMFVRPTPFSAERRQSIAYLRWVRDLWWRRAVEARREAMNPPHKAQWLCIHRFEGAWTDPNSPYYGGLQMDLEFQQTYGGGLYRAKGTADHWTPLEQMWVAERAYRTRGFWPWPNTARYCGLL